MFEQPLEGKQQEPECHVHHVYRGRELSLAFTDLIKGKRVCWGRRRAVHCVAEGYVNDVSNNADFSI